MMEEGKREWEIRGYRWKGGGKPAPERERVLYMMLSQVLANMLDTVWGGGNEDDRTSKR